MTNIISQNRCNINEGFASCFLLGIVCLVIAPSNSVLEGSMEGRDGYKSEEHRLNDIKSVSRFDFQFTYREAKSLFKLMGWVPSTKVPQYAEIPAPTVFFDDSEFNKVISVKYVWLVSHPSRIQKLDSENNCVGYKILCPEAHNMMIKGKKREIRVDCFLKPLDMSFAYQVGEMDHAIKINVQAGNYYLVVPIQKAILIKFKGGTQKICYTAHYILVLFKKWEAKRKRKGDIVCAKKSGKGG